MNEVLVALSALNELLRMAGSVGTVIATAHSEGRTISPAELRQIRETRNEAIQALDAAIEAAEAEER